MSTRIDRRTGCWHCGKQDHKKAQCPDRACTICRRPGHKAIDCKTFWCDYCCCFGDHVSNKCGFYDPMEPYENILDPTKARPHGDNIVIYNNPERADKIDNWRKAVVKDEPPKLEDVDWNQAEEEARNATEEVGERLSEMSGHGGEEEKSA